MGIKGIIDVLMIEVNHLKGFRSEELRVDKTGGLLQTSNDDEGRREKHLCIHTPPPVL